jgi:hypothetical protein
MSQYPAWLPEESEYLERLAGDVPFPELLSRMRRRATAMGWPSRSEKAILMRLQRIGLQASARTGAVVTTGGVAEILGCPATRVESWLRRPQVTAILQPRWIGSTRYIERRAWRRLAREMPRILGGYSVDALFALLEDRELSESIATRYRRPCGDWRIRCVETGRVYSSCGAAAAAHHVTQACISLAIRQRRPVRALGLTFEAMRSAADPPQPLQVRNRAA